MLAILGGTFDPIHKGHLAIAANTLEALRLERVEFIPANTPAHRIEPVATSAQRLAMVELAVKEHPKFQANPLEIERHGVSYAIDTVKAMHADNTLCFIVGIDAFLNFDKWKQWQDILNYCHLIVINRPGYAFKLNPELNQFYQQHACEDVNQLHTTANGLIYTLTIEPVAISATEIRNKLKQGENVDRLVPAAVAEFIADNKLYA